MEKPRRAEPQPAASVRLIDQIAKMTFGKLCKMCPGAHLS